MRSMFIYRITTKVAIYVVISTSKDGAEQLIHSPIEDITKLGVVSADVHATTHTGIVAREWRSLDETDLEG